MTGEQLRKVAVRLANIPFDKFCEVIYLDTFDEVNGGRQAYLINKWNKFCNNPINTICEWDSSHLNRASILFKDIFQL